MKKSILLFTSLFAIFMFFAFAHTSAQKVKGNKDVVKMERNLPSFTGINAGGATTIYITQGTPQLLVVETDSNLQDKVITEVEDGILEISTKMISNPTVLNIYVTVEEIGNIEISGAVELYSVTPVTAPTLLLVASGAAEVELELNVTNLESEISGASEVKLWGEATNHVAEISGASLLKAYDLLSQNTDIRASGASNAQVSAEKELTINSSGASSVDYKKEPEYSVTWQDDRPSDKSEEGEFIVIETKPSNDKTNVRVGSVSVVVEENDSVKVTIGSREVFVDNDGHVRIHRFHRQYFNGHWGGFHLGVNGYLNDDYGFNIPDEYEFLELKYEKSIQFQLNFYEQNINLIKNHFGMITGLGLQWNRYFFANDIFLVPDEPKIYGYHGKTGDDNHMPMPDKDYRRSKLVSTYLTVPLLLEYQTNHYSRINSFHLTAGVVGGWRMYSRAKTIYKDNGKSKYKERSDFHLQPFSLDAYAGIGWGKVNLYATYGIIPLFRDNRGPELYPFAIGIHIIGW